MAASRSPSELEPENHRPVAPPRGLLAAIRRFVRPGDLPAGKPEGQPPGERSPGEKTELAGQCDLCAARLGAEHVHLLEPDRRRILCACEACAVLFDRRQPGARYRRVPRRIEFWPDFRLEAERWDSLHLPIDLAFFFQSTPEGRVVAMYPSPAGATESLLDLDGWRDLVQDNPRLLDLEPDVEALLVNRLGLAPECYRSPIDECFKLVGVIRSRWRGLSGGTEVRKEITGFFADLKARTELRGRNRSG